MLPPPVRYNRRGAPARGTAVNPRHYPVGALAVLRITTVAVTTGIAFAACGSTSSTGSTGSTGGTGGTGAGNTSAAAPAVTLKSTTSQSATSAPAGGAGDPCALITEVEATSALGIDPGPGQLTATHTCRYGMLGSISTPTKGVLNIAVNAGYDRMTFDALTSNAKALPDFRNVAGVGDAAFSFNQGRQGSVDFIKGSRFVIILVQTPATPLSDQVLTSLGATAAGRL